MVAFPSDGHYWGHHRRTGNRFCLCLRSYDRASINLSTSPFPWAEWGRMGNASYTFSIHESDHSREYSIRSCYARPSTIYYIPPPAGLTGAFCLVAAAKFRRKSGSALKTSLLVWTETLYTMTFVPVAIRIMVVQLGLHYRFPHLPGRLPVFNVSLALLPLVFIAIALIVETVLFSKTINSAENHNSRYSMLLIGSLAALPALILPSLIVEIVLSIPFLLPLPVGVSIFEPVWSSTLLTLPLAIGSGILGALLGKTFGDFWHSNTQ